MKPLATNIDISLPDLPHTGPAIYGLKSVYKLGEFVNLTCESGPSSPELGLSWFLNSVKVQEESPLVTEMAPVYPLPDRRGISRSSISVLLTEEIFSRALEVECQAKVEGLYSESAVVRVSVGQSWRDWAQHFSGGRARGPASLSLLTLSFLLSPAITLLHHLTFV